MFEWDWDAYRADQPSAVISTQSGVIAFGLGTKVGDTQCAAA